ncbi:hypothetical protein [Sphingomonas fuzhouensis]|nr:hypothetical protein [Sphingomonas sp. SGZ-02]
MKRLAIALIGGVAMALVAVATHPTPAQNVKPVDHQPSAARNMAALPQ